MHRRFWQTSIFIIITCSTRGFAWRWKRPHDDISFVRFTDDTVVGFNNKADAGQFRAELTARIMREFNPELHPEKTRRLEFGPFAINNRQGRGEVKPETSNWLADLSAPDNTICRPHFSRFLFFPSVYDMSFSFRN